MFLTSLFLVVHLCPEGVFPGGATTVRGVVYLRGDAPSLLAVYMKPAKPSFDEKEIKFCEFFLGGKSQGFCFEVNEIGKELPITFLVCVSHEPEVLYIKVIKYRETRGGEIRSRLFMKQFFGKTPRDPLRVGRDIRNIRGATLSAWATTRAVRKAFALLKLIKEKKVEVEYIEGGRKSESGTIKKSFLIGDTFLTVHLSRSRLSENQKIWSGIENFIKKLEKDFSNFYFHGVVSMEIKKLIRKYIPYAKKTNGYFDIFWRVRGIFRSPHIPEKYADISAVWKGYFADRFMSFAEEEGFRDSVEYLNFGNSTFYFSRGRVRVFGTAVLDVGDKFLSVSSTSGEYSVIFDPTAGRFVRGSTEVAVIHRSAEYADFASTLCAVAGEKCKNFLEKSAVVVFGKIGSEGGRNEEN